MHTAFIDRLDCFLRRLATLSIQRLNTNSIIYRTSQLDATPKTKNGYTCIHCMFFLSFVNTPRTYIAFHLTAGVNEPRVSELFIPPVTDHYLT